MSFKKKIKQIKKRDCVILAHKSESVFVVFFCFSVCLSSLFSSIHTLCAKVSPQQIKLYCDMSFQRGAACRCLICLHSVALRATLNAAIVELFFVQLIQAQSTVLILFYLLLGACLFFLLPFTSTFMDFFPFLFMKVVIIFQFIAMLSSTGV